MIPVEYKPVLAKDIPFDYIVAFKTESYVGIWCPTLNQWLLVPESSYAFNPKLIDDTDSLSELDKAVYDICDEYIQSVAERADYKLTLTDY